MEQRKNSINKKAFIDDRTLLFFNLSCLRITDRSATCEPVFSELVSEKLGRETK